MWGDDDGDDDDDDHHHHHANDDVNDKIRILYRPLSYRPKP